MKHVKDINEGDIFWIIDSSIEPKLIPLKVINIEVKEYPWTKYYYVLFEFPDKTKKEASFFWNGNERDYDIPFLQNLYTERNNYLEDSSYMMCHDKEVLLKKYIDGLKSSIKTVKDVINKGKNNLFELYFKLNYIIKEYKNITNNCVI